MLTFSQDFKQVTTALLAVQREIQPVTKDRTNTFFNAKYATLDAITDYIRPLLAKNELVPFQTSSRPFTVEGLLMVPVRTRLVHVSGEWVENVVYSPLVEENGKDGKPRHPNAQSAGKVITYLRRYGLSSLLGITTDEDTDGQGKGETAQRRESKRAPRIAQEANGNGSTTVGDVPFPAVLGFEAMRGKPLRDVSTEALTTCYQRTKDRPERKAQMVAKAVEEVLETRRVANDFTEPHPALAGDNGNLIHA